MVQDWSSNLIRWNAVNHADTDYYGRNIEPLYVWLMSACKPLTFFGWLMLCAFFELSILFILITRYMPPKYYWASIFVLMAYHDNGLLLINSNRQTIALVFTIIGVLFLQGDYTFICKKMKINKNIVKYLIAILCFISAINIHGGAFPSMGIIPLYYLSGKITKLNKMPILMVFCSLYLLPRFFDCSFLKDIFFVLLKISDVKAFEEYAADISLGATGSIVSMIFALFIIIALSLTYHIIPQNIRFFSLCVLAEYVFGGFFTSNLHRIMQYYYIYSIIAVPYVFFSLKKSEYKELRNFSRVYCLLAIVLYTHSFYAVVTEQEIYNRWVNFQTIFDAPLWY